MALNWFVWQRTLFYFQYYFFQCISRLIDVELKSMKYLQSLFKIFNFYIKFSPVCCFVMLLDFFFGKDLLVFHPQEKGFSLHHMTLCCLLFVRYFLLLVRHLGWKKWLWSEYANPLAEGVFPLLKIFRSIFQFSTLKFKVVFCVLSVRPHSTLPKRSAWPVEEHLSTRQATPAN